MKRILLSVVIISIALFTSFGQNKKAERDSINLVKFNKAVAAIEAKDFVIIVATYQTESGSVESNYDDAVFLSYEKEFLYLQGQLLADNSYTNKLNVSDYSQSTDKKGNIRISMQVRGFFINGKIEMSIRKGNPTADVIITPSRGSVKRFSGEVVPRHESKYFKRTGEV